MSATAIFGWLLLIVGALLVVIACMDFYYLRNTYDVDALRKPCIRFALGSATTVIGMVIAMAGMGTH